MLGKFIQDGGGNLFKGMEDYTSLPCTPFCRAKPDHRCAISGFISDHHVTKLIDIEHRAIFDQLV